MRLWSLHPKYLDPKGLVALWREALLARAVIRGETRGYRHHPQLERFTLCDTPRLAVNAYLDAVLSEADSRGYSFDRRKVGPVRGRIMIGVTDGQLAYEWEHLLGKLRTRHPETHERVRALTRPEPHPLFSVGSGPVERWERVVSLTR
jgi:hypothetical protein